VQEFQLLLTEPSERVLQLTLIGEVDLATVEPLRSATQTAIASGDFDCLIFDLRRLGFIDSSGLHTLVEANRAMAAAGGSTKVICGTGSNLLKIFELTGLDRIFPIVSERAQAITVAA
jgi:anti-anti-sigma factor